MISRDLNRAFQRQQTEPEMSKNGPPLLSGLCYGDVRFYRSQAPRPLIRPLVPRLKTTTRVNTYLAKVRSRHGTRVTIDVRSQLLTMLNASD